MFCVALGGAPPVPERNFDEEELMESLQDPIDDLPPPPDLIDDDSVAAAPVPEHDNFTNQQPEQVYFFVAKNI